MHAFLEYVVKGLVQYPDAVTVTPVEREGTTVYELHARDCGREAVAAAPRPVHCGFGSADTMLDEHEN